MFLTNIVIVCAGITLLLHLSIAKNWLIQAIMYVVGGVTLYALQVQVAVEDKWCELSWDNDWVTITQQIDTCVTTCSNNLTGPIILAQILLISGPLGLILVPFFRAHLNKTVD